MTPSGIEPATFRYVAQWLNQLRYGVRPNTLKVHDVILIINPNIATTYVPY